MRNQASFVGRRHATDMMLSNTANKAGQDMMMRVHAAYKADNVRAPELMTTNNSVLQPLRRHHLCC